MDIWQYKDVLLLVLAAGSVYGAIRSDMRHMHERVKRLEDKIFE